MYQAARYGKGILVWLLIMLVGSWLMPASAAERSVSFRNEGSRFRSSEESRQAAESDANKLIGIAQERYGITLDRSENSIVELQRVAELVRGEMQPWRNFSEWRVDREQWAPLLASYLGEVLVAHRGAHWGTTDFIGGSDRALGFPKSKNIVLPVGQMDKALQFAGNICGWYLIDVTGKTTGKLPEAIETCSKQPWQKTKAEEEYSARLNERVTAAREREQALRKTARTSAEIREVFRREAGRIENVFHGKNVSSSGRVVMSLTVSPEGAVTEAHIVSSDFGNPDVEAAVLAIVRGMRFEARDVPVYTEPAIAFKYSND